MKLYRITQKEYLSTAWSGYGAQQYGGRWNSPGYRLVYTASSISLAVLEVLVHLRHSDRLSDFSVLESEAPDSQLLQLPAEHLPTDWQVQPSPDSAQQLGDDWAESEASLGLIVPSVIVPQQVNVLLNTDHPEMQQVIDSAVEVDFTFDPRLHGSN